MFMFVSKYCISAPCQLGKLHKMYRQRREIVGNVGFVFVFEDLSWSLAFSFLMCMFVFCIWFD